MAVRRQISSAQLKAYKIKIKPLVPGFDALAQHVVITDPEANILYMNKAAEQITGYTLVEALRKNPGDLWGGNMPDEFYSELWDTIKKNKHSLMAEVRNTKKDGTEYWQELIISPVLDALGKIQLFIAVEPNITERKKNDKFREEFISIVSHQLKNPLTNTRWTLELLLDQKKISRAQKKDLEVLYNQNQKILNLVGDLLILSRVEKAQVDLARVDLAKEIKTIVAIAKANHPSVKITFQPTQAVELSINKTLALQVFYNIIMNAAEYSNQKTGAVDIQLKVKGKQCSFICQDNGIGIPKKEQTRVFTQFFRGSNTAQLKEGGTGLGLFIVKLITDNLGWKVSFTSTKGEGTTFTVNFPLR